MAQEEQRYGRNKDTLVNKTYVDSGEYKRKFDNMTDNPAVNKSLYDCAKKVLKHRSGTLYEDMYWIDGDTGKIILGITDSTEERGIPYSDRIMEAIKGKNNIITIHTHPGSMPPSAEDFNLNFDYNYSLGVVACHNGKLFVYKSDGEISKTLYNLYIGDFEAEGLNEYEAQIATLEKLKENHDIDFWEVF